MPFLLKRLVVLLLIPCLLDVSWAAPVGTSRGFAGAYSTEAIPPHLVGSQWTRPTSFRQRVAVVIMAAALLMPARVALSQGGPEDQIQSLSAPVIFSGPIDVMADPQLKADQWQRLSRVLTLLMSEMTTPEDAHRFKLLGSLYVRVASPSPSSNEEFRIVRPVSPIPGVSSVIEIMPDVFNEDARLLKVLTLGIVYADAPNGDPTPLHHQRILTVMGQILGDTEQKFTIISALKNPDLQNPLSPAQRALYERKMRAIEDIVKRSPTFLRDLTQLREMLLSSFDPASHDEPRQLMPPSSPRALRDWDRLESHGNPEEHWSPWNVFPIGLFLSLVTGALVWRSRWRHSVKKGAPATVPVPAVSKRKESSSLELPKPMPKVVIVGPEAANYSRWRHMLLNDRAALRAELKQTLEHRSEGETLQWHIGAENEIEELELQSMGFTADDPDENALEVLLSQIEGRLSALEPGQIRTLRYERHQGEVHLHLTLQENAALVFRGNRYSSFHLVLNGTPSDTFQSLQHHETLALEARERAYRSLASYLNQRKLMLQQEGLSAPKMYSLMEVLQDASPARLNEGSLKRAA